MASGGEGTRVVFVSVRGRDAALPRTRRKRAMGVPDGTSYDAFVAQLCARLQLRGVKAIFHAASGAPVRSLDEVADVEDLEVQEVDEEPGAAPRAGGNGHAPYLTPVASSGASLGRSESARKGSHEVAVSLGSAPDADEGDKYARRVSVHARVIQHVTQALPSWASAALAPADGAAPQQQQPRGTPGGAPASRRLSVAGDESLGEPSGKRRKNKRTLWQRLRDPRVALLLIAAMSMFGTMALLYGRSPHVRAGR